MMIKYRVHEVAKDLNVPSKEIIDLLQKHFGEVKKHMTALTEEELDVIFEHYTQLKALPNFDAYFAENKTVAEDQAAQAAAEAVEKAKAAAAQEPAKAAAKVEKSQQAAKKEAKPAARAEAPVKPAQNASGQPVPNQPKRKAVMPGKITPVGPKPQNQSQPQQKAAQKQQKPAPRQEARQPQAAAPFQNTENSNRVVRPQGRIIDTRSANVNIDKYNEKYDRMASEKYRSENTVQKQKITQKSQQRGKPRNSRKETEAERLRRIAMERKAKPITIQIPDEITVGELALRLKATAAEVIKKLMMMGTMATVNDVIDFDTAALVAMEFHANVTAGEAGGITQHIGAYRVNIGDREITFLDTPGHEAFTTMRARGAQVTDIAILVVAADDGIMPQTIEAINHAKAAGVSVIVAINKMDKMGANPERVKEQLTEYELVPEEWGGDTPCIPVSAHTKEGIGDLLEMVTLIADMKELKANPDRAGKGTVIEARLDKGRGPIATVLVQNGTLHVGDIIVAGTSVGRVRAMMNDRGERVQEAGPSVPVEITGLDDVPTGGDTFNCVSDERLARELVDQRKAAQKEEQFNAQTKVTLDNLFDQMQLGDIKELKIIVKADVQGSVEAVRQSLEKLSNDEVRVHVIHGGVGAVNESDVMLANASNAIIVGFNVRPDPVAAENAERDKVDMRLYRVIYDCIEEIESAMKGMLAPKFRENLLGRAECRQVYKISNVGTIAGSYVLSGKITRNAEIRIVRDGIVIGEDKLASLRRFKDDVKEVASGYECGIGLERFNDIKEGDVFEAFVMEEYRED